jgi:hypothetical protein
MNSLLQALGGCSNYFFTSIGRDGAVNAGAAELRDCGAAVLDGGDCGAGRGLRARW